MTNLLEMTDLLKNFCHSYVSFLCVLHSFGKGELCTSQRQASIKLIEKKKKKINSKLEADFSTK